VPLSANLGGIYTRVSQYWHDSIAPFAYPATNSILPAI
jgi:hypothetical protein